MAIDQVAFSNGVTSKDEEGKAVIRAAIRAVRRVLRVACWLFVAGGWIWNVSI